MMSPLRRGLAMGISSKQVLQGIAPPFENLFSLGQRPVLKLADSLAANTKLQTDLVESHNVVAKLHSSVALGVVVATHDRASLLLAVDTAVAAVEARTGALPMA